MGIISRLYEKRSGLSNPDKWLINWLNGGGTQTSSGIELNEIKAINYIPVYSCITLLSRIVASLPIKCMKRIGHDRREPAKRKFYGQGIINKPNSETTSYHYRETSMGHLVSWGNWYSQIIRDQVGRPLELWPLRPDAMEVKRSNGQLKYKYTSLDGNIREFNSYEILHIPGFGFDGVLGYSPLKLCREAIGSGMAAERYSALYFKNGGTPSGVAQYPGKLSPEAIKTLKESLNEEISGDHRWKVLLLEEGLKWETIGIPPEDSQLLETRKFSKGEIADMYLIPRHMIGDLERATFSNIEHQGIQFTVITMAPWLTLIEESMNKNLLLEEDQENYYYKFNMAALMRGDSAARATYYREMFNIGAFSINNILGLEDMNPVEIENGDEHFVNAALVPLSKVGKTIGNEPIIPKINGEKSNISGKN